MVPLLVLLFLSFCHGTPIHLKLSSSSGETGKRLILQRHAQAVSPTESMQLPDHERPLTSKGESDSNSVGKDMKELDWIPEHALVSDSVRTVQTWKIIKQVMFPEKDDGEGDAAAAEILPALYNVTDCAVVDALLEKVSWDVATLIVVGHNPILSTLVQRYTNHTVDLPTAGAVLISCPTDGWVKLVGACSLLRVLQP